MSQMLLAILSALVSILAGGLANYTFEVLRKRLNGKRMSPSYSEKMAKLTEGLIGAASEVDRVLNEMSTASQEREANIVELETKLADLVEREKSHQENIRALERVPLPAAEYFVEALERKEKRSAWRDYLLFGLGVVVSTLVSIALRVLFAL